MASVRTHDYDAEAQDAARELGLDFAQLDFEPRDLALGMSVEYEHGLIDARTNVTDDDPTKTAKIALAHLYEHHPDGDTMYDYYDGLDVLEEAPTGQFRGVDGRAFWRRHRAEILIIACIFIIAAFAAFADATDAWKQRAFLAIAAGCLTIAYMRVCA